MKTDQIVFSDVSKFYGEVLGVNHINLNIPPGLTGLVGPNGSGKSTLMNLMAGLLRPCSGSISVLGIHPQDPEALFSILGYCTQYDTFPVGATGLSLLVETLGLHGLKKPDAVRKAMETLELLGLGDAAERKIAGYSKGMRQRVKLASALVHEPRVLILDEPLNGLDPMGRAEVIDVFKDYAAQGRYLIVSSHILHEVDVIAENVIMIHGGSILAEGGIREVRSEITNHPIQVLIRCTRVHALASRIFLLEYVVEGRIISDGILVRTRDAGAFFAALNDIILETGAEVETVMPADESIGAVYDYLIGNHV